MVVFCTRKRREPSFCHKCTRIKKTLRLIHRYEKVHNINLTLASRRASIFLMVILDPCMLLIVEKSKNLRDQTFNPSEKIANHKEKLTK